MHIFTTDQQLIELGVTAMKIMIIAFPTVGFQVIGATIFQAMGKVMPTFLLTLSRQILLLIPLVLILPHFWQMWGIWISFPIADGLSALLTLAMVLSLRQKYQLQVNVAMED